MKSQFFAGLGLGLILLPAYAFLKELGVFGNYLIVLCVLAGVVLLLQGYMTVGKK